MGAYTKAAQKEKNFHETNVVINVDTGSFTGLLQDASLSLNGLLFWWEQQEGFTNGQQSQE